MEKWKKALVFGSLGAGAVLLLSGRRPAGVVLAGVGLTTLALEYPEKFEQAWRHAPQYIERGSRIAETVARVAGRVAQQAERQGLAGAWKEISSRYVT